VSALDWLAAEAARRDEAGLTRRLHARQADVAWIDLAGNDYLGLSRDPRVIAAAAEALHRWGTGATGSRLVTGTTELHAELESALAGFAGAQAALVFSSGYAANLGAVTALAGPGALVVSDAANHASIVDACRLARSRLVVTPHGDTGAVDRALAQRGESRALVVAESVTSADGRRMPLAELHAVCRDRDALLVVDEAHALGVAGPGGRGLCAGCRIAAEPDVVRTVTLSKSLGSQGGAVLGTAAVVGHLVNTARTFIFDTGLAPASAAAALRALEILAGQPELAGRVRAHAATIARELRAVPHVPAPPAVPHVPAPPAVPRVPDPPAGQPDAAIVPVVLGDPARAVAAAEHCRARGVLVGCFRPPSVPPGTSRLRLTARADLTEGELAKALAIVREAIG
jgi:8-amino-7-oxononanoate synthase